MKHFLTIILFILFVSPAYSQSGWIAKTISTKNLVAVNFINSNTGFITANGGNIFKTTNGGNNWMEINTGINESTNFGRFNDENFGYISRLGGISITTNGGVNWITSFLPSAGVMFPAAAYFTNNQTGYAVGTDATMFPNPCCHDGVLFKTTNGGLSWIEIFRELGDSFIEMYFLNDDSISVLGSSEIFYTYNGGANWLGKSFFMTPFIAGDSYTNPFKDTLFLAGFNGGILRSTNNGNNWSPVLTSAGTLRRIRFSDSKIGYAIGANGKILHTTNSGENWQTQISNTMQYLFNISILNKDTVFIVGDSGKVLRTYTGGLTSISQNNNTIPQIFTLEQNYPNPFNNETIINYELRTASGIRLYVYDVKGVLIKTLINRKQQAGKYRISFNAGELPSGLYFYKLEAENFSEIKKMLLIK